MNRPTFTLTIPELVSLIGLETLTADVTISPIMANGTVVTTVPPTEIYVPIIYHEKVEQWPHNIELLNIGHCDVNTRANSYRVEIETTTGEYFSAVVQPNHNTETIHLPEVVPLAVTDTYRHQLERYATLDDIKIPDLTRILEKEL